MQILLSRVLMKSIFCERFEVYTVLMIQVEVFWVVTPWRDAASIFALNREAARSPETLLSYRNTIRGHNPEDLDMNPYTEAGIAQWYSAGLRAGWSGVWAPAGAGIFLFTTASRPALGPIQPPIKWVARALSLGVKQPGREADHSKVKEWMELYLHSPNMPSWRDTQLKHRDNFTFTLALNFNYKRFKCTDGWKLL
jgi:hypothetical protein